MAVALVLRDKIKYSLTLSDFLEGKQKLTYHDLQYGLPEGHYEIIDGEVKEVAPTGFLHGRWEYLIAKVLEKKLGDKGFIAVGEVGILISKEPLRIRGADVIFIAKERLDKEPQGILEIAPDLIIEIISPTNSMSEIDAKIRDYLKIGVKKVILVNPHAGNVTAYSQSGQVEFLRIQDEIVVFGEIKVRLAKEETTSD